MNKTLQKLFPRSWKPGRAAIAGILGTVAYTLAMEGDIALTGNRFNDIRFIQVLIRRKDAQEKRFLPGPTWLKGAIFGEFFIVSAWWLTPIADKYHPLIKSGELPKLATWLSFGQNVVRHLIFGLTLGLLSGE
jgi:hypothetical protein